MDASYKMQFGWPGDNDLGMRLIEQVRAGGKTATCCPELLYEPGELDTLLWHVSRVVPLVDKHGIGHGYVLLREVRSTTWGDPHPELISGEGHETAEEFRDAHEGVWDDLLPEPLHDSTLLIAELFEFVECERTASAT